MTTCNCHTYVYNDDGYEVCFTCGRCSKSQTMLLNDGLLLFDDKIQQNSDDFSYILENHHIGYIFEICEEYKHIKRSLKRGYPNIVLFAYSTYKILLANSIFYPITHISRMFQLENFPKYFSLIEKNPKVKKSLHLFTFKHFESSIRIFLSQFNHMSHYKRAVTISKFVFKQKKHLKPVFQIALALYFTLHLNYKPFQDLITIILDYFQVNQRTLKKKIRNFSLKHTLISRETSQRSLVAV